jgi:hypothetical protein
MLVPSNRKDSRGRPGRKVSVALLAALACGLPSAARAQEDAPAEGVGKVRIEGVVVRPVNPDRTAGKPVTVILGETAKNRREFTVALPVRAGSEASDIMARSGTLEVQQSLTSQSERYNEWVRAGLVEKSTRTPSGIVVLEQAVCGLEVSCPREVPAGQAITIEVVGTGEAVDLWNAWLVYPAVGDCPGEGPTPDGSRYEQQSLKGGAKSGGAKKLTVSFNTFPADRGKLLGVCVARSQSEDKGILWVQVK